MTGNKKSFSIISVSSKTFSLILDTFDYAVTLLFNIKQKIQISFVSSAISKAISSFTIKKIKITFITSLIGKQIQAITSAYPELDARWLLTGEGEMLQFEQVGTNVASERTKEEPLELYKKLVESQEREILWLRQQVESLTNSVAELGKNKLAI